MSDFHEYPPFAAPDIAELNAFFPGYEIEGLIATSSTGAVYCAVQKSLERRVALKILPREFSIDVSFREGFKAEAKAMARLKHPNLIGIYDFGEMDGMLYVLMEYVPGQSIHHSAQGQAIDPGEVVRLVSAICSGLAHAHENGIIHKQLRPSNILLDLSAMPKIGDFGVAWPTAHTNHTGEPIFETLPYTAPEVLLAPYTADHRADIYSVGVILHELLTGKLPADDPRPPSEISGCDPRFDALVAKATSPDAASRYRNAAEMAEELLEINYHKHRLAPTHADQPKPIVYQKKAYGTWLFLFALILAAGAGIFFYQNNNGFSFLKPSEASENTVVDSAPDPTPESIPSPDPLPESSLEELAENTTPEPAEPSPVIPDAPQPKLDMDGFYQKAHRIMQDRARSQINQFQVALKQNMNGFTAEMRRSVRNLGVGSADTKNDLEESIKALEKKGNRLPPDLDATFEEFAGAEKFAPIYLSKQAAIEADFRKKMGPFAATYILGMQKQIERSQAENDAAAIALIEAEIQLTRQNPEHFPNLMLGVIPKSSTSTGDVAEDDGFVIPPDSSTHGIEIAPE